MYNYLQNPIDLHVFEWCSTHGKDGWPVSTTVIQLWNDFHTFTVFFGAAPGEQQWRSCRSMIAGNVKVTSISKGVGILTSQPCCTMLWDRQWTRGVASSSCLGCGNLCRWVTGQGFQQVHDGWVSCKGPNDRQMCAFNHPIEGKNVLDLDGRQCKGWGKCVNVFHWGTCFFFHRMKNPVKFRQNWKAQTWHVAAQTFIYLLLACLPDGLRMFDACFVSPKLWYFAKQLDHLAWCQVDPGAEFSTQVTWSFGKRTSSGGPQAELLNHARSTKGLDVRCHDTA